MSSNSHQLRSWLFTPATRPDRFERAASSGADVVIIDLEDAVAPAEKDQARVAAIEFFVKKRADTIPYAIRINGIDTSAGLADIASILESPVSPNFLILPKSESADHLAILDRLLSRASKQLQVVALVESAKGLANVEAIAAAPVSLAAVMFGAADMAADLGAEISWEPLLHARMRLIAACACANVLPLDAPYFDIHDNSGLGDEVSRSAALGFAAKAAIHPSQIEAINIALTPSDAAIARARQVLRENAKGVGIVDGQMIDEAVARKARRILTAAGVSI